MSDAPADTGFGPAQWRKFFIAAGLLALAFGFPLTQLCRFAAGDELFSYIPLMPLAAGYLAWTQKNNWPRASLPARRLAGLFVVAGALALAGWFWLARSAGPVAVENRLALSTLAWLLFLAASGCWFLGGAAMRVLAFPFLLLVFMVPFPVPVRDGVEMFLQQGSAGAAHALFAISGMPLWRNGMVFQLPGITLRVAPECSGIHSTLVLFITSLVAGQMLLRRPAHRVILCLAVIPLALLRNGFRVFVIGELCVHVGPQMIDSPIHHRGGPLFFVLSLVPFFLLLYFLRRSETAGVAVPLPQSGI